MSRKAVARFTILALIVAASVLASPKPVRAQWEQWVGGWMITFFGVCGGVGCTAGQHLCATVDSGSGPSYCYEH
jgi:hypothetical protein